VEFQGSERFLGATYADGKLLLKRNNGFDTDSFFYSFTAVMV
jgi:hypothetical protein